MDEQNRFSALARFHVVNLASIIRGDGTVFPYRELVLRGKIRRYHADKHGGKSGFFHKCLLLDKFLQFLGISAGNIETKRMVGYRLCSGNHNYIRLDLKPFLLFGKAHLGVYIV